MHKYLKSDGEIWFFFISINSFMGFKCEVDERIWNLMGFIVQFFLSQLNGYFQDKWINKQADSELKVWNKWEMSSLISPFFKHELQEMF